MVKRAQPERRLHIAIADTLRVRALPGLFWLHIPNGEKRSAITGALLHRMGARAGAGDFLILWKLPGTIQAKAIFLELKAGKGPQSPAQKQVEIEWTLAGGVYKLARSYDEAIGFLELIECLKPDHNRS
jgi:hypothetical protein